MNTTFAALDNVCRDQLRKIVEPKTGRLRLRMTEHPGLNDLVVLFLQKDSCVLVHNRVLDANPFQITPSYEVIEEQRTICHQNPTSQFCFKPPHTTVTEVGAWRVSDDQIPFLFQQRTYISFNVERAERFSGQDVT